MMKQLDIIVPVYRGLQETKECLLSSLQCLPDWAQLIVINDASPEPELTSWLRQQAEAGHFTLLENEHNLGFVGTVNRGMLLNPDRDVLLLNSDVEVAASDWLERMREAAYIHDKVASLTPFSNNATICSFPDFCADNELFAGLNVTELDTVFSALPLEHKLIQIPTGVGFCMYMRRDCMNEVGLFDEETFGKGYGEENDWCQRAAKAGFVNYHQLNVFAYHKGGVSFQEEGDPRKARAMELLEGLHPEYTADVHRFIAADPARQARQLAALALVRRHPSPRILLVTHRLGGGVTQHLGELQHFFERSACFLRLMPAADGEGVLLTLSPLGKDELYFNLHKEDEYQQLLSLLKWLGVGRVHFHHVMDVPEEVLALPAMLECDYELTVHDYYLVNANPSLTDERGHFAGDEPLARDTACARHYPLPEGIRAEDWRARWLPWLQQADRLVFPSRDVAARFLAAFNNDELLAGCSVVACHPDGEGLRWPTVLPLVMKKPLKVLVLGALSREKGAEVLEQVAGRLSGEVEFHLLGYGFRELKHVVTHGAYVPENLQSRLRAIDADLVWFPALWPETYSYTFSIALSTGLPVVYPNLGAFAERAEGREASYMLPWNLTSERLAEFWQALAAGQPVTEWMAAAQQGTALSDNISVKADFYGKHYLTQLSGKNADEPLADVLSRAEEVLACQSSQLQNPILTLREKLLLLLWRVRQLPAIRGLVRQVPYSWQQKLKLCLSKRQLHEILRK